MRGILEKQVGVRQKVLGTFGWRKPARRRIHEFEMLDRQYDKLHDGAVLDWSNLRL